MPHIDESANGTTLTAAKGEELEVSLAENATTGHVWKLKKDGAPACSLISDSVETATVVPGRGGIHKWTFRVEQPGRATIELDYGRPWDEKPVRTFTVQVESK